MAYQTGSAVDLEDLLSKLFTFATANGWVQDQLDNSINQAALHKGTVFISMAWNTTSTTGEMSIHQATAYVGGNRPGTHTNDSGNGFNTSASPTQPQIITERCVFGILNGPYASYHFFEQDSGPAYLHVVVQVSSSVYRHFGFGNLVKTGDWTGGAYCYGHYQNSSSPIAQTNSALFDGLFSNLTNPRRAATIHVESLPNEPVASKWGQIWGQNDVTEPADEAGNAKMNIQGGFSGGPIAFAFGWLKAGTSSGLIPSYPIALYYVDDTVNNFVYFLGFMPDVRGVNIATIAPEQEVTIGADIWIFFPSSQQTSVVNNNRTFNQGIMYKKVTA